MVFVKLVKNKAYFMRYQTKFRRRRQGKTDYYARKRLIIQDKDKYNTPKYRLVARITSTRVIAQVIYATITGDKVFCQADSQQLRKYGLITGLANYASAYATGLLLARRLLKKIQMDQLYEGNKVISEDYDASKHFNEKKPFKLILDVGLRATKCGSKVFAVMKGASDGGLHIPHDQTRFPTTKIEEEGKKKKKQKEVENKILRSRILGGHIDDYMKKLKGTEKYALQFKIWDQCLKKVGTDTIEKLYLKIHEQIRKNPTHQAKKKKQNPKREHSKYYKKKLTRPQKKQNARKRIQIRIKQLKNQSNKKQ